MNKPKIHLYFRGNRKYGQHLIDILTNAGGENEAGHTGKDPEKIYYISPSDRKIKALDKYSEGAQITINLFTEIVILKAENVTDNAGNTHKEIEATAQNDRQQFKWKIIESKQDNPESKTASEGKLDCNRRGLCKFCGGRLALVSGNFDYTPDPEPFESGIEEDIILDTYTANLSAMVCVDCGDVTEITYNGR